MRAERATEDSALMRMRLATQLSHQELESLVESLGLLRTLDGFAWHLTLLYRHCASHHGLLAAHPDLQALVAQRRDELHVDLQRLSREPSVVLPRADALFSRAQCFGFTYVTEGSRLGALAIAKRLTSQGISTGELQSLGHCPTRVRERWCRFCKQLSSLPVDQWDAAATTAVGSFRLLQQAHREAPQP